MGEKTNNLEINLRGLPENITIGQLQEMQKQISSIKGLEKIKVSVPLSKIDLKELAKIPKKEYSLCFAEQLVQEVLNE